MPSTPCTFASASPCAAAAVCLLCVYYTMLMLMLMLMRADTSLLPYYGVLLLKL
jgi:hypothetical protein